MIYSEIKSMKTQSSAQMRWRGNATKCVCVYVTHTHAKDWTTCSTTPHCYINDMRNVCRCWQWPHHTHHRCDDYAHSCGCPLSTNCGGCRSSHQHWALLCKEYLWSFNSPYPFSFLLNLHGIHGNTQLNTIHHFGISTTKMYCCIQRWKFKKR